MTRPSKPRKSGGKRTNMEAYRKHAVLMAALAHVPFDGFTDSVVARGAAEAGVSSTELARLFPDGPLSLVETFSEWADAEMLRELAEHNFSALRVRERIALAVMARIAVLKPHKEAARRAAAFLTLPLRGVLGMTLLYRTVDAIWRGIGDTSTDFNFYSKRAILAAVYSTTLMRWFSDTSVNEEVTHDFLRRRIDDVMRFEKFKTQMRERATALPSLSDLLSPGSRRRAPRRPKARAG